MHFSHFVPAAAGLIGLAHGHLGGGKLDLGNLDLDLDIATDCKPALFDLGHSWDNEVLFHGICSPETENSAAVSLGLSLHEAQISGSVSLGVGDKFLAHPTIKIGLGGIKAYVELDLSASAGIQESIELFASPELSIDLLDILEIELGAAFALDLVLAVDAAVDLTAGFYLSFDDSAFVEVSLITKDVVNVSLGGLTAKALPIGLNGCGLDLSAEITLDIGLRLRTQVAVSAGVDIGGLDVLGAEAVVAIWVNLFDYTAVLVGSDDCVLSIDEEFALAVGVAVKLDVEVLDILDISLAPTVFVKLAAAPLASICLAHLPCHDEPTATAPAGSVTMSTISASTVSTPAPTASHSGNGTVSHTTTAPASLITSTTSVTSTYTITSCAASVKNCPASYTQKVVTSTVIQMTTVCPATQTSGAWETTSTKTPVPVKTITETLTTVVPCEPTSTTFTAPTTAPPAPTVIIDDTTTVCPATSTPASHTPASTGGPGSVPASTTAAVPATSGGPIVGPSVTASVGLPAPNGTWTSIMVTPTASWVPAPPSSTPTVPAVGGAASLKVGMVVMALPAVLAALL